MSEVLYGIVKNAITVLMPPVLLFTSNSQAKPDNYYYGSENITPIEIIKTVTPTNTPTPSVIPTPTLTAATSDDIYNWIEKYANFYSIDRNMLMKIAICESSLKPNAVNGIYGGLYQFSPSAWKSTRYIMNSNPDLNLRFNPQEAIKTAAFKISTSGTGAWPNCGR